MTKKIKTCGIIVLCGFLTVCSTYNPAFAAPLNSNRNNLEEYNLNGIRYYDASGLWSTNCYQGDITISGTTAEEKIWTGLLSFMTAEQAAGVMGNMAHESNYFNPVQHEVSQMNSHWGNTINSNTIVNNSDLAYGVGLIQWSFGHRTDLLQYIQSKDASLLEYFTHPETYSSGFSINGERFLSIAGETAYDNLVKIELEYLKEELQNKGSYKDFFNTTTVEEAADFFLDRIERPADPDASRAGRRQDAQNYYEQLKDVTYTLVASAVCSTSGNFQSLVLQYAWPEYHQGDFINMMPAYASAVARRQQEGKYVGGAARPGIDCGGFVTALMQDSGFEPNYNSGRGGTDEQERWVNANGWTLLNSTRSTPVDTSTLQPGDVAFTTGHTFVYVGDIPGFGSNIASASYGGENLNSGYWRAPMAGKESLISSGGETVRWYRKGGTSNE